MKKTVNENWIYPDHCVSVFLKQLSLKETFRDMNRITPHVRTNRY